MGLFSKNWAKELDRAEDLLQRDLPVPALEIAERAASRAGFGVRERAAAMVTEARKAVLASVLAKAAAAEAGGDLEDAADWLQAAVEQEPSAATRSELEARRAVRGAIVFAQGLAERICLHRQDAKTSRGE